jgi:hypothetical protein
MANWVKNITIICGTKKQIINLLNKVSEVEVKSETAEQWNAEEWNEHIKQIASQNLTLRSWYQMPKTFIEWDTTNPKTPFEIYNFKSETEEDKIIEYNKYCAQYESEKLYQLEMYGAVGWYDYNMLTLGCKWNCKLDSFAFLTMENNHILIELTTETPWSTPHMWFTNLIKDYGVDIVSYADEEGGFFNDVTDYKNERIIYDVLAELKTELKTMGVDLLSDSETYYLKRDLKLLELQEIAYQQMKEYALNKIA